MSRDYYAKQDTANQALKVKEDDSYYDFLKEMPLDDKTILADEKADIFTNRFEFMAPPKKLIRMKSKDRWRFLLLTQKSLS